jgi:simple sugar transport system ATP-binding protein
LKIIIAADVMVERFPVLRPQDRAYAALEHFRGCRHEALPVVSGNGQRELAEVISGLREATTGRVFLNSRDITGSSAGKILELGLSYVPEERMKDGMIRDFTVSESHPARAQPPSLLACWIPGIPIHRP